jgi:endonuclease YncB( thermonuclease family)
VIKQGWVIVVCWLVMVGHAEVLHGRVVKVSDGDSVVVLDASLVQHTVRLVGIDAPEKKQAFGWRAKYTLGLRVFGQPVRVDVMKKDRYGRLLGQVWLGEQDINLAQIETGMAWHYAEYARDQRPADRLLYATAQEDARQARRGLWQDPNPIAPWQFRRSKR